MIKNLTKHILFIWVGEVIYHGYKSAEMYPIENEFFNDWWNSIPLNIKKDMMGKRPNKNCIDLSYL